MTPTPLPDETGEWEDVKDKFEMSEERTASALEEMRSSEEWSDECKLLMIAAFRNSCLQKNKLVKKLFNLKKATAAKLTGVGIFERWRHDAMATLEQLAPTPPLSTENWFKETCAYKLLITHIRFIQNCFVIHNKKGLDTLKTNYELDWNQPDYLNDVSDWSRVMTNAKLALTTKLPFFITNRSRNSVLNTMLSKMRGKF